MVYFATSNAGKLKEAEARLRPLGIAVKRLDADCPEIQADTLEEVAEFKLMWITAEGGLAHLVMLDDSGLFIDALGGFPGVYSAYVFKTLGWEGILKQMRGVKNRKAHFQSCIGYLGPNDRKPRFFVGKCDGTIAKEPSGKGGFGYDPIFVPDGGPNSGARAPGRGARKKTFAELSIEEKNVISHRGKSLDALVKHLETNHADKRAGFLAASEKFRRRMDALGIKLEDLTD